jgi:tRNASer (uridine44-2'-O)-methyltransferase
MATRIIIVMQDIGIATFLMLLWKDTYGPETIPPVAAQKTPEAHWQAAAPPDAEPWRHWPRPPGGFIDLGCGNGLLTHILISEGYAGYGFDLRARTSWTHYPQATQDHLLVRALDPTAPTRDPMKHDDEANSGGGSVEDPDVPLHTGCFLIGNHADELTPWIPALATRHHASGYLSIPCCAWSFDARFDRARDVPFCAVDAKSLNLGGEAVSSSYAHYRVWLAALSVHCGWAVEVEMLRIPSTRNWAIVGEFESFFQ